MDTRGRSSFPDAGAGLCLGARLRAVLSGAGCVGGFYRGWALAGFDPDGRASVDLIARGFLPRGRIYARLYHIHAGFITRVTGGGCFRVRM